VLRNNDFGGLGDVAPTTAASAHRKSALYLPDTVQLAAGMFHLRPRALAHRRDRGFEALVASRSSCIILQGCRLRSTPVMHHDA
jgi:hypothetical protein